MNRGVGARILRGPVLLFAILALCALPGFGQIDRGAIVGRVMDTSGGVVPKATITVTNKATGVVMRSEERRVGKECRSRGWAYHEKKKESTRKNRAESMHKVGKERKT